MRNLILVAFTEPVVEGTDFPREDWPLHITLVRFDVDSNGGAEGGDASGAVQTVDLPDLIAGLIDEPVREALGARLTVGADAGFGRYGSIPVNLVEPSQPLQALHEALMRTVTDLGGRVPSPHHTMEGFRPHVSHHGEKRLHPGTEVVLDRVALVDMAPDGNHAVRRILRLWKFNDAGDA
ncbi:2'-5' RNA ligase family protein [Arthrobacter sp. 92]|jgi:hypothetical protein|uniref:2'-5' RNA ligase family protein n=1 Tax=Arthrobacter sp. 92 TaxID=3418175 RepID=UPI003D046DB8